MHEADDRPIAAAAGSVGVTHDPPVAGCPFCERLARGEGTIRESPLCFSFFDTTPLTPGHTLVVPKRHVSDFLALTPDELTEALDMAVDLRTQFEERFHPDGFNLGVNIGDAAGQTIGHAHLHLIPRYVGDVPDPRGGIRWMIPDRARYWATESETSTR